MLNLQYDSVKPTMPSIKARIFGYGRKFDKFFLPTFTLKFILILFVVTMALVCKKRVLKQ